MHSGLRESAPKHLIRLISRSSIVGILSVYAIDSECLDGKRDSVSTSSPIIADVLLSLLSSLRTPSSLLSSFVRFDRFAGGFDLFDLLFDPLDDMNRRRRWSSISCLSVFFLLWIRGFT